MPTNKTVQENTDKQTQYKSQKVNNLKYSKTKLPWFSCLVYNTRPGNEVGLFYNAPVPTRGYRTCALPYMSIYLTGRERTISLYIGRGDVAVSVVTIRPPFCGYNIT